MKERIPEGGFLGVVDRRVVWGGVENTSLCRPPLLPFPPPPPPPAPAVLVSLSSWENRPGHADREGSVGWICLTLSKGFLTTLAWDEVAAVKITSQLQPGLFCGTNICSCP